MTSFLRRDMEDILWQMLSFTYENTKIIHVNCGVKNYLKEDYRSYTAISKKVSGKSAPDNPERYCGWFWDHSSSQKFWKNCTRGHGLCFRVLKRSSKSRFDSYSVRNSPLIISRITFRDSRVHFFPDNLSRNSCIHVRNLCSCEKKAWKNNSGLYRIRALGLCDTGRVLYQLS